jgi:hypothetical protein
MILLQLLQIAHGWLELVAYAAQASLQPLSIIGRLVRTGLAKLVEVAR